MTSQAPNRLATIIGANIREARLARKMTQAQLAAAIGVESMFISRWERGANTPADDRQYALADYLFDGDLAALYADPKVAA